MDGPVVKAAQKALSSGEVNLVLVWVQKVDEELVRQAFDQTLIVRKLSPEAQALADKYFFETLVRIHRAGEGASYTGLSRPAAISVPRFLSQTSRSFREMSIHLLSLLSMRLARGLRKDLNMP
jgi:hypothetical protein